MIGFVIGYYSVPAADRLDRWYKVTFIDLPKITSESPIIVVPESERNPRPIPGGGCSGGWSLEKNQRALPQVINDFNSTKASR
ncbi:MAG: hypothetical protein KF831_12910 [Acidobacteria bacterium]|nr:hypothetical protein [Acidobacteriota bacterium]